MCIISIEKDIFSYHTKVYLAYLHIHVWLVSAIENSHSLQLGNHVLGCARKLGSMVSKWVISPTYKWDILGWHNPLILTNHWSDHFRDPGHPSIDSKLPHPLSDRLSWQLLGEVFDFAVDNTFGGHLGCQADWCQHCCNCCYGAYHVAWWKRWFDKMVDGGCFVGRYLKECEIKGWKLQLPVYLYIFYSYLQSSFTPTRSELCFLWAHLIIRLTPRLLYSDVAKVELGKNEFWNRGPSVGNCCWRKSTWTFERNGLFCTLVLCLYTHPLHFVSTVHPFVKT